MTNKINFNKALILIITIVFFLSTSIFIINEGESGLVLRLGEILKNSEGGFATYSPGIHLKFPVIDQVKKFDIRLRTFNVPSSRILTNEQKMVHVDYYVKWKIVDIAKYYKTTNNYFLHAQRLLEQRINNTLRAAFGERTISDVVSGERIDIMNTLKNKANDSSENFGIQVVDVRLKQIDLPKEVSMSVYERMRTDRERVATKYRSDGRRQAEQIRATSDAEVTVILATAKEQSATIKAQGDAQAAQIYNDAYTKNKAFYGLIRSLQAYENSFSRSKDFLVLQPNTQYFDYFHGLNGSHKIN